VGLGNIAGVAVAITLGGPGAIFWMWVMAFFGMAMQFASCVLAQTYRWVLPDGHVIGGPMVYLRDGMREHFPFPIRAIGTIFSYLYAVIVVFSAFAAGNMFQGNQTHSVMVYVSAMPDSPLFKLITGLVLAFLVGIVIIGGIKRIGEVTSKLVPGMCIFYILVCSVIVFANLHNVPELLLGIVKQAFWPEAIYGGFIGVLVQGEDVRARTRGDGGHARTGDRHDDCLYDDGVGHFDYRKALRGRGSADYGGGVQHGMGPHAQTAGGRGLYLRVLDHDFLVVLW
jgi:AGCS family alanine or glycine:cation symporter